VKGELEENKDEQNPDGAPRADSPPFVEVFRSATGSVAVGYREDIPFKDGHVCLTVDMKTWRPLAAGGFAGSSVNHTVTCLDPEANDSLLTFTRVGDTLWWGGNALPRTEHPETVLAAILPLPRIRKPEYLFADECGKFLIYVSADKYNYSYEGFRLFVGAPGGLLSPVLIRQVRRMRDGGTTYIHTTDKTLYSPSRLGHVDPTATWGGPDGEKLRKLDAAEFNITETEEGVRISSRSRSEK